ncbi:SIS domain-containing protein [Komagataeibacter xylinus]|uniref:SIS domain-containing protein n=1 Tax=Komagataeibacter xylinus TaxID=28448 RepID=UPI00280C225D|nr:SIS domain-containing protein [Komagataeibacter xylinus]
MKSITVARGNAILRAEAEAIAAVELDATFDAALLLLSECKGKVVTTGMGKAGFVARKFAATLCSTGTPAVFLHPGEAAHGDLGVLEVNDCIVAFSTSGKTREVLELVRHGRRLGCGPVIGVTSHADSELRAMSSLIIDMGDIAEPCRLGLTPTASIAVMSSISDALALVLMEKKGITQTDYGLRHHGGYLGIKAREYPDMAVGQCGQGPLREGRNQ